MATDNDPRFIDPKLNAIRQALLLGDWAQVFAIAPMAWKKSQDPTEKANFDYWNGLNPLRKPLSFGDLRVELINGKITKVPFTQNELDNYFENYQLSQPGKQCTEEQKRKWAKRVLAGNERYLIPSQTFCKPEKSSRRKKKIKKAVKVAAAIGVGVAGAVFLGPKIAAVAGKAGSALGVGGGTIAANSGKLVNQLNNARTINALIKGKIPPPPIGLTGQGFRDWAFTTAQNELMQKYQRSLTRDEEKGLRAEIVAMQRELISITPQQIRPVSDSSLVPIYRDIQKKEEIKKTEKSSINKFIIPAALIAGFFLLGG